MGDLEMDKVFSSKITRASNLINDDLYELLHISPAKPIKTQSNQVDTILCPFRPNTDKYYIPKKRSRLKVKTVRDIRNTFEKDVYINLPEELEKQKNMLLTKIKDGSLADDQLKHVSNNILNSDNPISRTAWQMLIHVNPNNYKYTKQFVLWNGKYIHVNGSKGGRTKFICSYDLGKCVSVQHNKLSLKMKTKKIGLLRNSLFVKFKPGPLGRKKHLDESHQKYNVGEIELIRLPKPSLDILPTYGVPLDVNLTQFINNLRDESGKISDKWAEFATSVVGSVNKSNAVQQNSHCKVTFGLNYKYDQNRILMRKHSDEFNIDKGVPTKKFQISLPTTNTILSDVKQIVGNMLDAVELGLLQDTMFNEFDEPRELICQEKLDDLNFIQKEKPKRQYKELNRLDVTVIQLPDKCQNSFCKLGCICESLNFSHNILRHCGRLECIFGCKCDFQKYNENEILDDEQSEILPSVVNLDKDRHLTLSKEERKFHQTVIVSGEKRILLKPNKRHQAFKVDELCNNYKAPKSKNIIIEKDLSIVLRKLHLQNIEVWCMVHNLYKCFCKNRFIEKYNYETENLNINSSNDESLNVNEIDKQRNVENADSVSKVITRQEKRKSIDKLVAPVINTEEYYCTSARVKPFYTRKYNENYYKVTNKRILEMEKNDRKLQKKLKNKVNNDKIQINSESPTNELVLSVEQDESESDLNLHSELLYLNKPISTPKKDSSSSNSPEQNLSPKSLGSSKLVMWIESSYRRYKKQRELGPVKKCLEPPKYGKLAFHSWEFIFNRYKEKKNHILISKVRPFRIFMGVDHKHPGFENCINIDDIRFADLDSYPDTVRKLLTNCKEFKENFCIMRGLSYCWEIIGSVSKKAEIEDSDSFETLDDFHLSEQSEFKNTFSSTCTIFNIDKNTTFTDNDTNSMDSFTEKISNAEGESSRWFLMRIENDFSEIQFNAKGFFVKYESIVQAINVARETNKTVRISCQKCVYKNSSLQFGIYAIPNVNEHCVLVGPYETDEPLGIGTVQTFLHMTQQKRTRGVWITTNKVDNVNVINNPMSFMHLSENSFKEMLPISNDCDVSAAHTKEITDNGSVVGKDKTDTELKDTQQTPTDHNTSQKVIKIVKPIKIKKVNAVYRIAPSSILKSPGPESACSKTNSGKFELHKSENAKCYISKANALLKEASIKNIKMLSNNSIAVKPIAQIAPQINNDLQQILRNRDKTNMGVKSGLTILKPEEVVKILTEKKAANIDLRKENDKSNTSEEVLIISDDEENEDVDMEKECQNVKICCSTVNWVAWLPGRRKHNNLLSYEFPGCEPSIFYKEEEALSEVNRLFHNKVQVPANVGLMWQVIENNDELEGEHHDLTTKHLNNDFVLTSTGLRHKDSLSILSLGVEHDQPSTSQQEKNVTETSEELIVESSMQEAIVLEDGSLFLMDENNKTVINDNLSDATDAQKVDFLNVLETLKIQNTSV